MREKLACIYAIVNTATGRRYVGSTSDIHIRRIAHARLKGIKLSAEHRRKIGIGVTGTKKPASFIAALRKRNQGNKFALGLKRSRESVEASAASRRGRKLSEEHKSALWAAWVRRKAKAVA